MVSRILLMLVVLSSVVESQIPPEAVADSIFKATSNGGLEELNNAADQIQSMLPTAPDSPILYTLLGELYLRLGDKDKAKSSLEHATRLDSTLAAAHFGLGRVHLELREKPKDAINHFKIALRIDSTYADVHAQLSLAYQKQSKRRLARKQADLAIRYEPRLALPYRILAETYAEDNNRAASLIYFKRYLDRNPKDEETAYKFSLDLLKEEEWNQLFEVTSRLTDSRSLPLLATSLIHKGEHESSLAAFRDYIATLHEEEAELYDDITPVGLKREALAYRTTTGATREAFLNQFWMLRDPFKTSGGAMRRAEHYRRVWHARRHFGVKRFPWDRRGEIYIRYGKPFWRSTSKDLNAIVPAEAQQVQDIIASRLYGSESIDHTFVGPVYPVRHQSDAGLALSNPSVDSGELLGLQGFKPVTAGSDWSTVPWESWIYTDIANGVEISFTDEFLSGNFDYAPIPTLSEDDMNRFERTNGSPLSFISRMTEFAPASLVARIASEQPDRYDLTLLEPLHFFFEALAFKGNNGETDLQINIAIPIKNIAMDEDPDTSVIVERRVVLLRGAREISRLVENLSLVINDQNQNLGLLAVERINVPTEPGNYELRVQASRRNTNRVQVYGQALDLEDFGSAGLKLSDLHIAQRVEKADPNRPSKFGRKGWEIRPAPARTFERGQPLFVYYEIYNLNRDEFGQTKYQIKYEVETRTPEGKITIPFLAKLRQKHRDKVGFEFEQTGSKPDEHDYFELDLSEAKPGNYELEMKVTDLITRQTVSKQTMFTVSR